MYMIRHQAVGMDAMAKALDTLLNEKEETATIMVLKEYRISRISTKDNMIKRAWIMNTRFTSHS